MTKCKPIKAPQRGQNWKFDGTALLRKNRGTRNLSNSARRCEHSAAPAKFFQPDYSFAHERPHFFLNTPGKEHNSTWQCFRCHSWHNPFWPEYLTEAGNPKVASLKVRRVGRTAARSSCATNSVTRRSRDRRIGGKLRSARQAGAARFEADAPSAPYVARLRRQWPLPRFAPTASRSAGAASRTSAPRHIRRATHQARERKPIATRGPCTHCASREPLVFRGQVFFLCPSRANRIIKPPATTPLCARRGFRFRMKGEIFLACQFLEKCKIFLFAGGTCERASRRGTGGPIRSI